MRRWNGYGEETITYPLSPSARRFLEHTIGAGSPPQDAALPNVLTQVPDSRLPIHPLISVDSLIRLSHAHGQSLPDWIALRSGRLESFPDGVAFPGSEEDVRQLLDFASSTGARLIPFGGGTSVVGHVTPVSGEHPVLAVDMARMNRLLRFDQSSLLATFEAGVTGPVVEAQLRARGCTLGHFPQSFEYSTLGGWIATRSSGQQSLGYGRIEKLFAGGRLLAPVGRLVLPPFPASGAGPDLREAVLGSEGRLGILTEATVRASRLPESEDFHAVFFPNFEAGQGAARSLVQARLPLCMLRVSTPGETATTLALVGREWLIGLLEQVLAVRGLAGQKCLMLFGLVGSKGITKYALREALSLCEKSHGVHIGRTFARQWHKNRFHTPYLRNTLWDMGYAADTLETATSWSGIPGMLDAVESALQDSLQVEGERVHVFTHLSHLYPHGSSLYTTFLFRLAPDPDETLCRWRALKSAASQAILAQGGTISHQHGVGKDHLPYLEKEKGPLGILAIQDLFRRFDPQGLMNPGKLVV